jgi:hypothetical protein
LIIEIRSAEQALTHAERLLAQIPGEADLWRSNAVIPLAAALLSTAHAHAGFADLAQLREVVLGPAAHLTGEAGWASVAERCPDALMSNAAHRVAQLTSVQRDSLLLTAYGALSRS